LLVTGKAAAGAGETATLYAVCIVPDATGGNVDGGTTGRPVYTDGFSNVCTGATAGICAAKAPLAGAVAPEIAAEGYPAA
jgi:hypothetical protein